MYGHVNGPVTLGRIDLHVQETNVILQCSFYVVLCPVIIRQMRSLEIHSCEA